MNDNNKTVTTIGETEIQWNWIEVQNVYLSQFWFSLWKLAIFEWGGA